ncbi:MAG: 5'-3' exonuclease H3TH domain-containing protein, partial [Sphaerospermopsis kisseleviana]
GDRDLFQLIDEKKGITVLNFSPEALKRSTNSITEFQAAQVQEKLGVFPTQIVDFKALCGDKSDNIPGVKGIGEKTAVKLLNTYNSLEEIYANIDKITGANQKKLIAGKEDALHSQYLAKIVVDVPLEVNLEDCQLTGFDTANLIPILEKLEFKKFLEQINELQAKFGGEVPETQTETIKNNQINIASEEDDELWFFSAEDTANTEKSNHGKIHIRIIDTTEKLDELVNILEKCTNPEKPVAWDTETTDLEPRDANLVGIGCCWGTGENEVAYIPVGHKIG